MHAAWSDAAPAIGMHGCVGPSVTARGVQHITPARAADTAPMLRLWSWQCELLPAVSSRGPLTLQLEELIGARDGDGAVDVEELRALLRGGQKRPSSETTTASRVREGRAGRHVQLENESLGTRNNTTTRKTAQRPSNSKPDLKTSWPCTSQESKQEKTRDKVQMSSS